MSKMIRHKNYLLRRMRKTNIHEHITRFELFNTNLKKIMQEQKRNYIFLNFEALDCKQKWKHINNLLNKEQKIKQIPQNTVNEFLTHFSKTFSTCNANIINPCDENHFTMDSIYLNKANDIEVLKCFSLLKNKNARQTQDIPMFLWKAISVHILKPVTFIVNQIFTTGMFPSLLKSANITPIYKKGKHNMVENFRPISVTHNLSKILERIILPRIISFANKNNLLPPHQPLNQERRRQPYVKNRKQYSQKTKNMLCLLGSE